MSNAFEQEHQDAFRRAQEALEGLLQLQRSVKACAEALQAVAHDVRAYEHLAERYVTLLDEWDRANARYASANAELLKVLYLDDAPPTSEC